MGEEIPDNQMMWGAKVKTPVDMPDDMLKDAIINVTKALDECENFEADGQDVVANLKKYLDTTWTPNWHVVIGRNFGSYVTHETRSFLYFYYQEKAIMIYKAG